MDKVKLDGIGNAVEKILNDYSDDVYDILSETVDEIGKEAAKQVKANANANFRKGKGGKRYTNGWRFKAEKDRVTIEGVIYNANKPQLTHLLENGHAKVNGVGRVEGRPHIAPVNDWVENEVIERTVRRLQE